MARMLSFAFEWGKSSLSRGKYDWASPLVPESSRLNRWTWFDSFPLGWVTLLWTHISEAPISGTDLSIDTQHWMRMNPTCKIREVDQTTRVMEQAGPSEIAPQVPSSTGLGPSIGPFSLLEIHGPSREDLRSEPSRLLSLKGWTTPSLSPLATAQPRYRIDSCRPFQIPIPYWDRNLVPLDPVWSDQFHNLACRGRAFRLWSGRL